MEISTQRRLRLIRQTLSELPPPSNYTPVSDAIERSQTLEEKEITSTLAGLSSLPQSTAVFANPVQHSATAMCEGTEIELQIRSFSIRGQVREGEIVAGKLTPAQLIYAGLFGRRPETIDGLDQADVLAALIDRKFYRTIKERRSGLDGRQTVPYLVASFMKAYPEAGPELVIQHLSALKKGETAHRSDQGFSDSRHSGLFLIQQISNHMGNVAIGAMSTYMRYRLQENNEVSVADLAGQTINFVNEHQSDEKTAFQTTYSLLLGREVAKVEGEILEMMGMIQTHHGSAASNMVARYMASLHALSTSDFFVASQMVLDGKRHFGAIHNLTRLIQELEVLSTEEQEVLIRERLKGSTSIPTFGHPEISAAGRGNQIQQDPRAAIYLSPLFAAIDKGEIQLSDHQLNRLGIIQRLYQIALVEGVVRPGRENDPPLRLTPNTDFGGWSVQEALGISDADRTLLTYVFRGFGWMMDGREQLQLKIIRPVIAPDPKIVPDTEEDQNVPDQVLSVHDRLRRVDHAFIKN